MENPDRFKKIFAQDVSCPSFLGMIPRPNRSYSSINLSMEYHSGARDDAFTGGYVSGYMLLHSNSIYKLNKFNEIYLKIENILDQQYSLSDTAGSYGRTVSLGLKFIY